MDTYTDPLTGAIWRRATGIYLPTLHDKHGLVYIDGNSGDEMGTNPAKNLPAQAMPREAWHVIDLATRGIPVSTIAILALVQFVSSGYAGAPPVSLTATARAWGGHTGLPLGAYFAAVTAARTGGFRQTGATVIPIVDRKFEFSYEQPISTLAGAIAGGTGAPQIIQLELLAVFEG